MQVVLDANVYISALISDKGNPARIIDRWLGGDFDILVSQPIINEILRVTGYKRIQKKYARVGENRLEFVELLSEQGLWIEPEKPLSIVTADESDNRYIECAVAGGAQYIVSGDTHLLAVGAYRGIVVVTPAAFLAVLDAGLE